ncbi:hypothetical protein D3C87_1626930 [compost metagenome]
MTSSRIAIKVTTTPKRPSSAVNSSTNGTKPPPLSRSSTSLMRSRVDNASRLTWWLSNMSPRRRTSAMDISNSSRVTSGNSLRALASGASSLGTTTSRPTRLKPSMPSAAALKRSYCCKRRISSARGSSSSSAMVSARGSNIRDLISASIAAITRYSAASSRRTDCISST